MTVVTIDGPAGSGKSTVSRNLAIKLRFVHLNSGALYRAVAYRLGRENIAAEDFNAVASLAKSMRFECVVDSDSSRTVLLVDDQNIEQELLTAEAGAQASIIAVQPALREILNSVQRRIAEGQSVVVEGRDAGTVVFPAAAAKFYLDASLDVRAHRRQQEFAAQGNQAVSIDEVRDAISERDLRDGTREIAPQVAAPDAILVDTSDKDVPEVVNEIVAVLVKRGLVS